MNEYAKKQKRKEREKVREKKQQTKQPVITNPAADHSKLVREIQKLQILEFEGRLDAQLRAKKHNLLSKFNQINSHRVARGLDRIDIPPLEFDKIMSEIKRESKAKKRGEIVPDQLEEFSDDEFPDVPVGVPPPNEVIAHLMLERCFPDESVDVGENKVSKIIKQEQEKKKEFKTKKPALPQVKTPNEGLLVDYASDDEDEEESEDVVEKSSLPINPIEKARNTLFNAPAQAILSSEPQLQNLQSSLTSMVPMSVQRKKKMK